MKNVGYALISNIELKPKNETGWTGILLEKSPSARILDNKITGFAFGVVPYNSDGIKVYDNFIDASPIGQGVSGIYNIDGEYSKIKGNEIAGFTWGIFASDRKGTVTDNYFHDCSNGILLCNVPAWQSLPNGEIVQAPESGTRWVVTKNNATDNNIGYNVLDGANKNYVYQNNASNNLNYDINLGAPFLLFGDPRPASRDNVAVSLGQFKYLTVKDCGDNNKIYAGNEVDYNEDPCE